MMAKSSNINTVVFLELVQFYQTSLLQLKILGFESSFFNFFQDAPYYSELISWKNKYDTFSAEAFLQDKEDT